MKNVNELNKKEQVRINAGNPGGSASVVADENGNTCTDHGTPKIKIGYGTLSNQQ